MRTPSDQQWKPRRVTEMIHSAHAPDVLLQGLPTLLDEVGGLAAEGALGRDLQIGMRKNVLHLSVQIVEVGVAAVDGPFLVLHAGKDLRPPPPREARVSGRVAHAR